MRMGIQECEPKGQCQQAQQEVSRQEVHISAATLTYRTRLIRLTMNLCINVLSCE